MNLSDSPPKFLLAWAFNAAAAYIRSIPVTSQIGIQGGAASLNDGFPPLTFVPAAAGGVPPYGQDFNGILKQTTQGIQWQQAGGPIFYNSAFATSIGGYPSGAILNSAVTPGTQWMSTANNNMNDPDGATPIGWVQAPGQIPIGTPVAALTSVIPNGYVSSNGFTIGDASSNATNRANPDTKFLFAFFWTNCPANPIFTSGGSLSTRGASPAADFAAHKAIAVFNLNGTALMGADSQNGSTSSSLAGVPVINGSTTLPGQSIVGQNLHALTSAENAAHTHVNTLTDPGHVHINTLNDPGHTHAISSNAQADLSNASAQNGGGFTSSTPGAAVITAAAAATGITINNVSHTTGVTITNVASGSGTPHNTVPNSAIVYWNFKL
jgi:hypothetical protein